METTLTLILGGILGAVLLRVYYAVDALIAGRLYEAAAAPAERPTAPVPAPDPEPVVLRFPRPAAPRLHDPMRGLAEVDDDCE